MVRAAPARVAKSIMRSQRSRPGAGPVRRSANASGAPGARSAIGTPVSPGWLTGSMILPGGCEPRRLPDGSLKCMARIRPFSAFRYDLGRVRGGDVVTQSYDRITADMRQRYLAASPFNLVRVILGEKRDDDNEQHNVYTRAAEYLKDWIQQGVLKADPEPGIYVYSQTFKAPDTGHAFTRHGFIALGALEDYQNKVVYRHELTLSGPKIDRQNLLRATRTHFGQIFMLYSDPAQAVEAELQARATNPVFESTDEYGTVHRMFRETDYGVIARLEQHMATRPLIIADGHHRYETALQWR